jgi:hypothetical protein
MVHLAQTTHLSCTDTDTTSKHKEVWFHMTHITYEFHRVSSKWSLSLSYIWRKLCTYLESLPLEPHHLVAPSSASKMISEPMVCLMQTVHLSCTNTSTISKRKRSEIPHDPRHLGVPLRESKMIFVPVVCSTQSVHLSCIKLALSPKGPNFHLSLLT